MDGFQYTKGALDFFPHAACLRRGRNDREEDTVEVTHNTGFGGVTSYNYIFHYVDHLGNIRLRYGQDPDDEQVKILEEKHYYPFGLQHKGYNTTRKGFSSKPGNNTIELTPVDPFVGTTFNYGFGGKELHTESGLEWYDVSARNYDPALGRWMNIDPLAEQMRRHSPYNFAFDNPVYFQDYDGMMPNGANCCGDKPSPFEQIKQGINKIFSGIASATEQYFNDNEYSTSSPIISKPIENKSSNEVLETYSSAASEIVSGAKDSVQGAADATNEVAETVSEGATYTTVATGGASAPITVPLQKGADYVAGGTNLISASIDYSNDDTEAMNEKLVDAGVNALVGKAGSRLGDLATKTYDKVTETTEKLVTESAIDAVVGWFKDAVESIEFKF